MKKIIKFIMAVAVASSAMFYSCETIELELTENPNGLNPNQADPNLLLNTIQIGYLNNMSSFNGNAAGLVRINTFGSRDYFAGITGNALNGNWNRIYSTSMIPNINNIAALNAEAGDGSLDFQEGISKVMLAHSLMLMVDFIGDIPLSEAVNPDEFPAPNLDSGQSVYTAALEMLDEAQGLLNGTAGSDLFYGGDSSLWIRAINTIRLKAALTVQDYTTFDQIIAGDNFIQSNDQDFVFEFGTNEVNPDERHPDYVADYTPSGANLYKSNWTMDYMLNSNDPRIRYYFFRQSDCTPGASCDPDGNGETLSCSLQMPPAHITAAGFGDIFCFLEDGYWGRLHGNDEGTPPDNFFRTASGVYPAGGLFDDNRFSNVGLGLGAGGAGIEPFLLASQVDFMRAEVAMAQNNPGAAAMHLENAITKSVTKVIGFGVRDASRDTSFDVSMAEATAFVDAQVQAFNDATNNDDRMNLLAEQFWISQYGAGAEAYNFYRRTGFPTTIPPNLEPNPGGFVRSFPYATSEVTANPNISQKADQSVQVFWDTNPPSSASGGFPAAN
ncbi:SusD/RagB family nutrient-binding outer membrane lipoprotein [Dokdonia ponticola]|uniref:SusD/RagB family nutrient-binding outer membrane lipoprotein n=1 Tax=Dokdonia ponticola TaxID=2041041 RepID=A0ABV9HYD0_9FLAO